MDFSRLSRHDRIAAIGAAVVVLAAFLPWKSIFGISKRGIDGDGVITLVLGLVALAAIAVGAGAVGKAENRRRIAWVAVAAGALCALVALIDMGAADAIGIYLTLFGGGTVAVAAFLGLKTSA